MRGSALFLASLVWFGCQKAEDKKANVDVPPAHVGSGSGSGGPSAALQRPKPEQIPPPFDIKVPPADAIKTASGLIYKKLVVNAAGDTPKRNDTVMMNFTGWRQATGETFFSNQSRGQPMPLNLSTTAPGFTEGLQLIKKGEKAILWIPPTIGYKSAPQQGTPEALVYEVEVVDIVPAPAVPPDVAKPPDSAETTKGGVKFVVVHPGTGKDKARSYDNVQFNYTAWDASGRMFDSTEIKKRPTKIVPYREPPPLAEILTSMTAGERVRYWVDSSKMVMAGSKPPPNMPTGQLCYEVEVVTIEKGTEPPAVPSDVAKPPADAKKTAKGVSYKILKAGKGGPHPKPSDTVRVNYTGWTTDGKMFDSSVTRNQPAEMSLQGVIAGWTDAVPLMSPGDKYRLWIPEQLAYKGAPNKPQGMLVFDIELLEIKPPASPDHPPHHP